MSKFSRDRYGAGQSGSSKTVPEGVEGARAVQGGKLADFVYQLVGSLRYAAWAIRCGHAGRAARQSALGAHHAVGRSY